MPDRGPSSVLQHMGMGKMRTKLADQVRTLPVCWYAPRRTVLGYEFTKILPQCSRVLVVGEKLFHR